MIRYQTQSITEPAQEKNNLYTCDDNDELRGAEKNVIKFNQELEKYESVISSQQHIRKSFDINSLKVDSSDGDLTQLVSENTDIYNPSHQKLYKQNDTIVYNHQEILIDNVKIVKMMCGDSSDNIAEIGRAHV